MKSSITSDSEAEDAQVDIGRSRERLALVAVLGATLVFLLIEVILARWPRGEVRFERAPEHEFELRVDINAAGVVELEHLPGVGPALAERIVADRSLNGPFRSLDDLGRVRGVGPVLLGKIGPYLRWPASTGQERP